MEDPGSGTVAKEWKPTRDAGAESYCLISLQYILDKGWEHVILNSVMVIAQS